MPQSILVEIAEACRKEADGFTMDDLLLPNSERKLPVSRHPHFFHPRRLNYSQLAVQRAKQFGNLATS